MDNLHTPILFLIFNRPEETRRVFAAIRQARPTRLFIAADGPRHDVVGEEDLCRQTREIVKEVDWPCEVVSLFREENLGCREAVSSALAWFFQQVEEGIILEDDCLPAESFFHFCELMLDKYRNDSRIMMIAGSNFSFGQSLEDDSYYFSNFVFIWGWATWRRAWQKYPVPNISPNFIIDNNVIADRYRRRRIRLWLKKMIVDAFAGRLDTWDAQLTHTLSINRGLSIVPLKNQVSNIGESGTHMNGSSNPCLNLKVKNFVWSRFSHPSGQPQVKWAQEERTGRLLEKYFLGGKLGCLKSFVPEVLKVRLRPFFHHSDSQ